MADRTVPRKVDLTDDGRRCEHGAGREWWWKALGPGAGWAGGIGHCRCCDSDFGYIASSSFSGDGSGSCSTWQPPDLCGKCGGGMVHEEWGPRTIGEYQAVPPRLDPQA